MQQIDLREGARRQHRTVALFAVIQAWLRNLDGLVFQRKDLQRLLGLQRFKQTRIEWLEEDFREFFPYQAIFWETYPVESFESLYVSRVPLPEEHTKGEMTDKARVQRISEAGPRLAFFAIWSKPDGDMLQQTFEGLVPFFADQVNYDERFLGSYLSLLAQGQISPKTLPNLEE